MTSDIVLGVLFIGVLIATWMEYFFYEHYVRKSTGYYGDMDGLEALIFVVGAVLNWLTVIVLCVVMIVIKVKRRSAHAR